MFKDFPMDLITGNEKIDLQHMELVARVKMLHQSFLNGTNSEKLVETFEYIKCYIDEHLSTEQNYMIENNYPYSERHIAAHNEFIKDYLKLDVLFQKTGTSPNFNLEFNVTLINWLINHVLKEDQVLAEFMRHGKTTSENGTTDID